jgi:phage terminase large subunit GpA-like protein
MLDMNDAELPRNTDILPDGSFAKISMQIRRGGLDGDGEADRGLLKGAKSPGSDVRMLDCEFTITDGPLARRKFWQTFTVMGGKLDEHDPRSVRYHCEDCDTPIEEHHKTAMLAAGEWRATASAENPYTIGFHISALYSPVGWLSWEQIARDWEAAQGKPGDLKTFRNTVLGETWQDRGEPPDWERLVERREDFRLGVVAQDALVLTASVDVQDDRLECDIWAWAEGYSSWLVDHIVIAGSPRERAPWDALVELLARDWPRANGGAIRIS